MTDVDLYLPDPQTGVASHAWCFRIRFSSPSLSPSPSLSLSAASYRRHSSQLPPVVSPVTWTRRAGEPIEGRGGRGGGGVGAHRQSWRLSASSPAEYYIGHKLPPWILACEGNAFLHFNLTWRSRYWKLCGEGSGRPPRSEDPLDPPLESGRCEGNHSEGDNTVGIESILLGG